MEVAKEVEGPGKPAPEAKFSRRSLMEGFGAMMLGALPMNTLGGPCFSGGGWIPQQSDPELGISAENTFIYIRGYPLKDKRDKRLKAAHADPEFHEVIIKQEMNPETKLIVKAHNIEMTPSGPYTAIIVTK